MFQESCRVCLVSDSRSLTSLTDIRNDRYIRDIMSFVSGIEIQKNEEFPENVCETCQSSLLSAFELKQRILETEELLNSRLKDESDGENGKDSQDSQNERNPEHKCRNQISTEGVTFVTKYESKQRRKHRQVSEKRNKVPHEIDFKCHICNLSFGKVCDKDLHVKTEHLSEKLCKICGKECKTALSLETHIKFHFKDHGFMCELCSKTFRYLNRLTTHMKLSHSESKKFECDNCGLSTKFKNNIQRHMKSVHMGLRLFKCDKCPDQEYSTREALKIHLYRYHDVPAPIKCIGCSQGFTFNSELRAHLRNGFCSKQINAPIERRKKVNIEFLDEMETGEFICKICQEAFATRGKAQNHYYLKHKSSNKCEKCNVVFNNQTALKRHEKVKHQGYKPFNCEFCAKTFGQKVSLASHRNSHTGEKPFSCPHCEFKSGDHGSISKHKKKAHPEMITAKVSKQTK